ncbi:MAG: GMC family oxidoreductase N-terminal domain-containing protein [Alphaproteobacteria bacterium]|nr:GMC family oxidoreductase N-terminal domain-containing protein [Alphaproteobacteria bacterium]
MQQYDYAVIGAGSAGCTIATRLVLAGKSVLLLEAGRADHSPFVHIPGALGKLAGPDWLWQFVTEPTEALLGRKLHMKQGRALGGGSTVNGMIYIRGQAQDYDAWRDLGCAGWAFEDVLPVFKRSECNLKFADAFHGTDGPLRVGDARYRHPFAYAFIRAGQEIGIPYNEDFNGARQEGIGFYQTTIADGRRQSTAVAYLSRVRANPLLTLQTEALVDGLVLENGAAAGVKYRTNDNAVHEARVREEVIVSAGTFGSPKLLQLSGIGPAALLAEHGIPVVRDIPQVGENFQDHYSTAVLAESRAPISLFRNDKGWRALRHGLEYALFRSGVLSFNVVESGAFLDTAGAGRPDVQLHMFPILLGDVDRPAVQAHGLTISSTLLRPKARGSIHIRSRDIADQVVVTPNALGHADDMATMVRGLHEIRKMLRAPSLSRVVKREIAPGDAVPEAGVEEHARRFAKTMLHPCGTCRMGGDDAAVVDPTLRVRGVPRLRVADASVMPTLVSGNTNAPAIMIGERCADFLLATKG